MEVEKWKLKKLDNYGSLAHAAVKTPYIYRWSCVRIAGLKQLPAIKVIHLASHIAEVSGRDLAKEKMEIFNRRENLKMILILLSIVIMAYALCAISPMYEDEAEKLNERNEDESKT
jgi:hypothetical protein